MIALTLIAGDVADRRDAYGGLRLCKLTTLLSVFLLALCSLALAVLSWSQGAVVLIYTCLVFTGIARAFLKPASDALMWQLIPVSAVIRKEFKEHIDKFYWKPLFWSSSYYVASSGGAPIDKLRQYIKEQDAPTE
jgi:MFS family permease